MKAEIASPIFNCYQLLPSSGKLGETSEQNGALEIILEHNPESGVRIPLSPPV